VFNRAYLPCPLRPSRLCGVIVCSSASAAILVILANIASAAPKQLIEFGWDEPGTSFLRQHAAEMVQTPFDGCVFHVQHKLPGGKEINLTWDSWSRRSFTAEELKPALDDLKAFPRNHPFTHNFLRFNVTPGDVDWFDDFSGVLNNARLAGQLAHAGRCAGVLLDIEAYSGPVWDFHRQKLAATNSWSNYQAQVSQRGNEVMQAFQNGFPGLTIFLTFGYSIAWDQTNHGKKPLTDCQYGLLPAFLDGMTSAARGGTRLVDGCESAYGFKDIKRFDSHYQTMKTGLLSIVADPTKYHATFSLGFGLWMDYDWRRLGWDMNDFSKNYYTPDQFEASVRQALTVADDYVWIYTEKPRWWTDADSSSNLPPAYSSAVRNARKTK
jgi:hypothetical protein